jgi:hypothetical protein
LYRKKRRPAALQQVLENAASTLYGHRASGFVQCVPSTLKWTLATAYIL